MLLRIGTLGCAALLSPIVASAQADSACASEAHRVPDRLIGVWHEFTVTGGDEVFMGELQSRYAAGGCAFVQQFVSEDGAFSFRSLGHVDAGSGRWREAFVLSNGRTATYEWVVSGDAILLNRLPLSGAERFRLRITNVQRTSYEVLEESSRDGGRTWQQGERTMTRRVGPAPGDRLDK